MFTDNPTYFSVAGPGSSSGVVPAASSSSSSSSSASQTPRGLTAFFRRKVDKMGSNSSASVVSTSTTSTLAILDSERGSGSSGATSTPQEEAAGSATSSQRRSFRNLFRSVSANSDPEKTQQFLKGDPRPSDVAPPSPYLPHRSHSHSENDRRRPGRKKALKSASELLSNDMVYCGLEGEDDVAVSETDNGNQEVFLGVDDARYYNISATLPAPGSAAAGRRRHSIGTFLNKTNNGSVNQSSKKNPEPLREPESMAPPVPTLDEDVPEPKPPKEAKASRRRRHRSASSKGTRTAPPLVVQSVQSTVDDVVLVSSKESEVSALWINYLVSCFAHISHHQGRPPFKVQQVTVEETRSQEIDEKIGAARLQIIVVCPSLLDHATANPVEAVSLSRQLASDKVLAMMLGVDDAHVTEIHRTALVSYPEWRKFFVKDKDENFVGDLMKAALTVLGNSASQVPKTTDQTFFSVLPKKVKMGQSRVIALLNDPLQQEDVVTVVVDRCGEAIEVSHVKKRNPYTLQFSIPDRCLEVSMLVGVRISKNDEPLGVRQVKCESRLRELDQILRANDNPLEFMCQTLGFHSGDREQLDNWMVQAFQRNLPPHFNLLSAPAGTVPAYKNQTSPEETPTLLHFAARFGLEKLAWQLIECPGGDLACDLKNISELTPADLAEQAGHAKLAHALRGYMQMNEFTNMYTYLKVMSETTSTPTPTAAAAAGNQTPIQDNQDEYCQPRALTDAYMVPPIARPLPSNVHHLPSTSTNFATTDSEMGDYAIAPTPTPVQSVPSSASSVANGLDLPLQGYMEMHPAALKRPVTPTPPRSNLGTSHSSGDLNRDDLTPTPTLGGKSSVASQRRDAFGPQDELLEIIHDFKNNVFTISEVEKLVDNWKNRNDVQQNFKDKQRQLIAMRDEYERIQKVMKDNMKRATPFDRVKKFFTKGKKDSKDPVNTEELPAPSKIDVTNSHRPVSSLSLHSVSSSSSSGRMSMVSECSGTSMGDSGTHSDPEDRKRASTDKEDALYYEVPPAPRPYPSRYSPVRYGAAPTNSGMNNSLQRRQLQQVQKPDPDMYYITCPPSGLPIHSFRSDGAARELQTPGSPSEQPEYLDLSIADDTNKVGSNDSKAFNRIVEAPPPGMCIPSAYMSSPPSSRLVSKDQTISNQSETDGLYDDVSSDCGGEYVEANVITEALFGDNENLDTSDLPEYVNVEVTRELTTTTSNLTPQVKKLPAPPIPPRNRT